MIHWVKKWLKKEKNYVAVTNVVMWSLRNLRRDKRAYDAAVDEETQSGNKFETPSLRRIDLNLVLPAEVSIQQHGAKTKAT